MTKENVYCWVCGDEATSREHKIKRSDIKQIIGEASQSKPIYVHDKNTRNKKVQSTNAKFFKGEKDLCAKCNNELTQPYDRSWERLSCYLYNNWKNIMSAGTFRMSKVFPHNTSHFMKDVHLYFAKLLGCAIREAKSSLSTDFLAEGIRSSKAVPNLWLGIGKAPDQELLDTVSRTDLAVAQDKKANQDVAATQLYTYGSFSVLIQYSTTSDIDYSQPDNWHPLRGSKLFILCNFQTEEENA